MVNQKMSICTQALSVPTASRQRAESTVGEIRQKTTGEAKENERKASTMS